LKNFKIAGLKVFKTKTNHINKKYFIETQKEEEK